MINKKNGKIALFTFTINLLFLIFLFVLNVPLLTSILISLILFFISAGILLSYFRKKILNPMTLINIFIFFTFVFRPIMLLTTNAFYADDHVFKIYNNLHGLSYSDLQFNKVLLIGMLGEISLFVGYYILGKNNNKNRYSYQNKNYYNKKALFIVNIILLLSLLLMIYFVVSFGFSNLINSVGIRTTEGIKVRTTDILWIYIGTISLYMRILLKNKFDNISKLITIIFLIVMSVSQRLYAVNLLLGIVIINYYYLSNKQIDINFIGIFVSILIVVIIYGNIRANLLGRDKGDLFISKISSEFSMFDMLLVSFDYEKKYGNFSYNGFNFLSIFDLFLSIINSTLRIANFDKAHTNLIFNERYGGAVPTSLIGSLYLNFSYIGLIIGLIILGKIISKVDNKKYNRDFFGIINYILLNFFFFDLIRVGDIGREFWTLVKYFLIYYLIIFILRATKVVYLKINNFRLEDKI